MSEGPLEVYSPDSRPAQAARSYSRRNAVLAGLALDAVDFVTAGPFGLYGGFIFGAAAGWWAAREFGFGRRGRLWMALAGAVYAATPFTEFLPLGTLTGALVRLGPREAVPVAHEPDPSTGE